MNQHRITPLTESGLLSALTVVLALTAVYLPVVGAVVLLIWALPVIVLVVRHGMRWGIMAVVVSGIIMALLIDPMLSLRLVIPFAPTGLALGYGFRKGWSGTKVFCVAITASLVGKLAVLGLLLAITAVNPLLSQVTVMQETFNTVIQTYENMGLDTVEFQQGKQKIQQGLNILPLLLPLVVIMMGMVDTVIGYIVGSRVLRRIGTPVAEFPPFAEWRLPQFFLYLFGFALVGLYWGQTRDIQPLYQAALNANMLAIFAGMIQGLSLAHCVMRYYRLAVAIRVAVYFLLLMNGFLAQIVAMTGLIDMLFDYRRRFAAQSKK